MGIPQHSLLLLRCCYCSTRQKNKMLLYGRVMSSRSLKNKYCSPATSVLIDDGILLSRNEGFHCDHPAFGAPTPTPTPPSHSGKMGSTCILAFQSRRYATSRRSAWSMVECRSSSQFSLFGHRRCRCVQHVDPWHVPRLGSGDFGSIGLDPFASPAGLLLQRHLFGIDDTLLGQLGGARSATACGNRRIHLLFPRIDRHWSRCTSS